MKKLITAVLLMGTAISPAFAADQYTAVKDTVGNCSAVVASSEGYPGMTVISDKNYSSLDEANKSLDSVQGCSGLVR
jgi:hypothetical protein